MKIKSILLCTCALGFMFASLNAATITLSRGSGNPGIIPTDNGVSLSLGGYYIACGTFTNGLGVTELPVLTTNFSSLLTAVASFDVFASMTAPTTGATIGTITGSMTGSGSPDVSVFNSKPMYFLVGNAATASASTGWSIFGMTTPAVFPANVAAAGTTIVSIPNGASVAPIPGMNSVIGNSLVVVPEPSAALLGALGALGLLRRRRN